MHCGTARPLSLVLAALALSACGGHPPAVSDPVEGVPLTHQRTITRNEVGYKWPFDAGSGTVACDGGALLFRAGGTTYALTGDGRSRGYASVDGIRRLQGSGPPSDPVSRLTQEARMERFAELSACRAGRQPESSTAAAECTTRIRERAGLSESEMTRIQAEGVERHWPPLPSVLMSLDAIVEAARRLCT
jgi:hypothetical protein